MSTLKLTISYDGGAYTGWARQPGQTTVQGRIEAALEQIVGAPCDLAVAGRTDAGVHARAQVASFEWPEGARWDERPADFVRRLNAVLPNDVAIVDAEAAPDGFSARHDAVARTYGYRVYTGHTPDPFEDRWSLWWGYPTDRELLDRCADAIVGQHDFTAFTPTQTDHVHFHRKVLGAEWREVETVAPGEMLELRLTADAFMRNMVRILVGTMLEVGTGRRSFEDFTALLEGAPRSQAGPTAPPRGLHLISITY